MKSRRKTLQWVWLCVVVCALWGTSGLLFAKSRTCCSAMAAPGVYVAQAQLVESGPQSLSTQAITGSLRTSEQEFEWLRLNKLTGDSCTEIARLDSARRSAAQAAWIMGLLHLHGIGTTANPMLARQCFMQAWNKGEPMASAGLAWCAIEGCGQAPQPEQARQWLQRLEAIAPARALYMRWWLSNSLAPLPPPQGGQGALAAGSLHSEWLEAAAKAGDLQARIEWGLLQASLLKWSEALRWFDLAASYSSTAKLNAQRIRQQLQHQEDAKRLGSDINQAEPEVIYRQARRYHQGDGIPANYAQALMLYQLAAARSFAPAQRMLNLIYSRPSPQGGIDIAWMQQLAEADVAGPQVRWSQPTPSRSLTRDPTAVFDYLPEVWKTHR